MILLLAADRDDALRYRQRDEPVVWVIASTDVRADVIQPGARIVRTDRWLHDERIVSALKSLAVRVPLADPTGLLGPADPAKRDTPVSGPTRAHNDRRGGAR